jgi:hypothetical protein
VNTTETFFGKSFVSITNTAVIGDVVNAEKTLMAGFTAVRDVGSYP